MNGYVYLWTDTKTDRVYVGARKGTPENDRYICSSKTMKEAYCERPQDFVREILFQGPLDQVAKYEWDYQIKLFENQIDCYNIKPTKYNTGGHLKIFSCNDPEFDLFESTDNRWSIFQRKKSK